MKRADTIQGARSFVVDGQIEPATCASAGAQSHAPRRQIFEAPDQRLEISDMSVRSRLSHWLRGEACESPDFRAGN